MDTIRVEYLVTVDQKDPFCNSVSSFNNYLRAIDGLRIQDSTLTYGALQVAYEVQTGDISKDRHRFFHLRLLIPSDLQLAQFDDLLRKIRTLLARANNKPVSVLWDGVSYYYSLKAYPLIYDIENTMRKLIAKFMYINIGLGWISEAIPQEVADSIRTKGQKNAQNYLYEVDFIQLSHFLFREYATLGTAGLFEKIKAAKDTADLRLDELRLAVPRSNWERYFSSLVDCESDYLRLRWERLYERRNQIAHNRGVTESEYQEIASLVAELKPKLQEAIDGLDRIVISDDEREAVAENAASTRNALVGQFLAEWRKLQDILIDVAWKSSPSDNGDPRSRTLRYPITRLLQIVAREMPGFSDRYASRIDELRLFRNQLVHFQADGFSETELREKLDMLVSVAGELFTDAFYFLEEKAYPSPTPPEVDAL